jgi:hypothetical protein
LTSALDGSEWLASRPGRFIPRVRVLGAHWIAGWDNYLKQATTDSFYILLNSSGKGKVVLMLFLPEHHAMKVC